MEAHFWQLRMWNVFHLYQKIQKTSGFCFKFLTLLSLYFYSILQLWLSDQNCNFFSQNLYCYFQISHLKILFSSQYFDLLSSGYAFVFDLISEFWIIPKFKLFGTKFGDFCFKFGFFLIQNFHFDFKILTLSHNFVFSFQNLNFFLKILTVFISKFLPVIISNLNILAFTSRIVTFLLLFHLFYISKYWLSS